MPMHILSLCRLTTGKVHDKLQTLADSPELSKLTIVRHRPVLVTSDHAQIDNVAYAPSFPDSVHDLTLPMRIRNMVQSLLWGFFTAWRRNVDVVYGIFLFPWGLFAFIIGKLLRKKVMISLIGTDLNDYTLKFAAGPFFKWLLRHTDCITVVDEDAKERLAAVGVKPERIHILPNAVDLTPFINAPPVEKDLDAIYVGFLAGIKGVRMLPEVWRYVVQARPENVLGIVGDGELKAELQARAAELGIAQNIRFIGWVDDVPAQVARAKVYLSLSEQEGVPTALLEAMSAGLVPVHTRVGGVPSVIREGENGFMVDYPVQPQAAAQPILRLLNNDDTYVALQAEALKVRDEYSFARVTAAWDEILKSMGEK